jgi:hypothetical protein
MVGSIAAEGTSAVPAPRVVPGFIGCERAFERVPQLNYLSL